MDFKVNTSTIVNVTPKIYEIYPTPQNIIYIGGEFQLNKSINIVYDNGIDSYTKNRVTDVLKLQNLENTVSTGIVDNKINFLVGINKSNGIVDQYFSKNISYDKNFFNNNIDSYLVIVKDGIIGVLGKDTDGAFYGVTTLKHVFNQIGINKIIQNFRVDDYANIAHRGFIEGYYGNPWSNDDRAELMEFGGDYKLNQYVFAPKDDVYHNKNWRDLYPTINLVDIQKLAMVGNQTKNRYVYALHPFMYNPIRFNTDSNYQADLNTIRQKFNQLLQVGVRQFAILADDASEPTGGPSMYVKLLTDLTTWLKTQQATYPDLKTDLMFCPSDYMGDGQSTQLRELNKASSNVSIVVTGGKIWGEVDEKFSNNFINNIATSGYPGRAPFYWINWPCSDNSKKHLIIGGNNTFLHPGITPSKINGIILNPMQQAEANKSALFAISDYAWNIWDTKQQGDQNWYDSFKYMDHGTSEEIKSSFSLREISKHMINQNMDGRVTKLEESLDLAPKLIAFKKKYNNGDSIKADAAILIGEFTKIKDAATYYKNNPSNGRTRDAIIHWLNCWQDTTTAVISYLTSIIAIENGDGDLALKNFLSGQSAFEKSKTYGFFYVDHTEYAEVGVQYIVPFIADLGANLSTLVSSILDPSKAIANFITNRVDSPTGIKENIFDQNPNTELVYKTPNNIDIGTFVGVKYSTLITLNKIEFLMGTNANLNDTMKKAKLQYTVDDKIWLDLESGKEYDNPQNIKVENLNLSIKGVRLIETVGKSNTWLGIRDINVNKTSINYLIISSNSTLIRSDIWQVYQGNEKNITDKNDNTDVWYKTGNGDTSLAGEFIGLDLGKTANLYQIRFVIGRDGSGDKWRKYKLEYSIDNKTWITIKSYDNSSTPTGKNIILESFQNPIVARYVRITNLENINKWVIFSEISIYGEYVTDVFIPFNPTLIRSDIWQVYQGDEKNITDKNDNTDVWYKTGNGDISLAGEFIGFNLGKVAMLDQIRFVMGRNGSGDKWRKYKLEYSIDNKTWITIKSYDNSSTPTGKDIILENFKTPISANYIRFTNLENINKWLIFTELSVVSNDEANRGDKNNIYTNTNLNIYSIFSYNLTKLKPFPALKLNSNEYVGIKLDRIKALSKIIFDATNIDKLVLQTSLNEIEWLNISNTSVLTPARYIRIRNNSTSPVIFDLNKFEILSNEITAPKLVSAYIGDTGSEKAVDGDLKTSVKFNGPPKKGDTIVYDLGQEILINNLKYVVLDTEKDHIRDGKIQLSLDGITWIDAITIGDGIENSVTNADSKPVDNGYTHGNQSNGIIPIDSAYMERPNLNIKARYVRIFITASYAYRWIVINELMINNGQYIPIINDPTFVSDPIEERGFAPSNLIDGKLTTSYKPNTKNGSIRQGSLTYRLSEKTDVKKIIIVQDGNTISNAIVTAKVIDTTLGATSKLAMLGSLSKTLNIFTTTSYKNVLEIKISWNKIAPNIYEIITL